MDLWSALVDGVPFFIIGYRDYETFNSSGDLSISELRSIYQILDNHFVDKEYTVESYNSYCRAHFARLARTVNRSERMIEYSLALLNVMYPRVFSREKTSLNEAYLKGVQYIRNNLI